MGIIIGMDEAGYGPNLGPLVITATAWRVPGSPRDFNFWTALKDVISNERPRSDDLLHVADSKQVYSPSRGLRDLERSILPILSLADAPLRRTHELCNWLSRTQPDDECLTGEPWYSGSQLELPFACTNDEVTAARSRLFEACRATELRLVEVRSEIVLTERFNELCRRYDSKGIVLSKLTMSLLRSIWNPDSDEPVLIIGDKHGGRNRYDDLLDEHLDGRMIFRVLESRHKSSYRVGKSDIHFQQGAESHFPVAVSSMVCKYVRELAMELFNQFWHRHVADLKPTKGYPQDAKRFRADVDAARNELEIPDNVFWRER